MTRLVTFSLSVRPSPGGLPAGPMALTCPPPVTPTHATTTSLDSATQLV